MTSVGIQFYFNFAIIPSFFFVLANISTSTAIYFTLCNCCSQKGGVGIINGEKGCG